MNIQNIVSIISFNPVFFMLLIAKSFKTLPKHNGYAFFSESYALN